MDKLHIKTIPCVCTHTHARTHTRARRARQYCKQVSNQAVSTCANADKWAAAARALPLSWSPPCICPVAPDSSGDVAACVHVCGRPPPLRLSRNPSSEGECAPRRLRPPSVICKGIVGAVGGPLGHVWKRTPPPPMPPPRHPPHVAGSLRQMR